MTEWVSLHIRLYREPHMVRPVSYSVIHLTPPRHVCRHWDHTPPTPCCTHFVPWPRGRDWRVCTGVWSHLYWCKAQSGVFSLHCGTSFGDMGLMCKMVHNRHNSNHTIHILLLLLLILTLLLLILLKNSIFYKSTDRCGIARWVHPRVTRTLPVRLLVALVPWLAVRFMCWRYKRSTWPHTKHEMHGPVPDSSCTTMALSEASIGDESFTPWRMSALLVCTSARTPRYGIS